MARRTRYWLAGGALALAVLVGVGWWVFTTPRYRVPLPPADATPAQVAMAYMHALDADDRSTAEALSTPGYRSETDRWLRGTAALRRMKVTGSTAMTAADHWRLPGQPWTQETDVSVEFDYQQAWWDDDPSFVSGHHLWGYLLVRDGGRWLVNDCGTG
ncbi:hypothetical protein [Streptacidiphilus cavernicola]|uniref:DUF4829 domain-containing protein n=1 Tax=Streptacidiphilus cavernicola TaxID=3342716 RepID=A0ABV6VNI2_9ACTN